MNRFADNPLKTRADLARLAADMIAPLIPCLSEGKARLHLGNTGAAYDDAVAGMEGFSRVLWALVPMLAGGCPEAEEPGRCGGRGSYTASTPATGNTGATSGPSTSAWWRWP